MLLAIFYFLKDGIRWKKILIILSPLSDTDDRKIIDRLKKSVNGVMRGYLLISVIQGLLMSFGLWLLEFQMQSTLGVVAAVASLIPMIGTAFVSVPAIIFFLLQEI